MKKLLFIITLFASYSSIVLSTERSRLKENICNQLINQRSQADIIEELTLRLFPNGAETDLCLKELVASSIPDEKLILRLMKQQKSDGSWPDIEYNSQSRSAWPTQQHQERLMKLAQAYRSHVSPLYNSKELSSSIHRGMKYWCDTKPECPNWWYNEIGSPKVFAPVMLLMENELTPEELKAGITILDRSQLKMTGQNKVWLAGIVFIKGLLLNDPELLSKSSEAIRSELKITTDEGLQPDFSFHQHGAQQQFGNYGLAFASSQSYWMRMLANTTYDFAPEQKEYLRNYLLKGLNYTIWKGTMDISACGRQLFLNAPQGKAGSLLMSMEEMIIADPKNRKAYEAYINRNFIDRKNELVGATHFWRSDYSIYRTPEFMISVKMCSPRVIGSESTNRENLLGFYLGDGATYTYVSGKEYENIFPLWDWRKIPGVTAVATDEPIPFIAGRDRTLIHENESRFVGGVTAGIYGITAMDLKRKGVSGRKGWFFIGNRMICLGAGLQSEKGLPLTTGVEQSLLQGEVVSGRTGKVTTSRTEWFVHNNIGYWSMQGEPFIAEKGERSGNWKRVADFNPSKPFIGKVFQLHLDHQAGKPGQYAYTILPNCTPKQMEALIQSRSIEIRSNTPQQQTIECTSESLLQSICYEPTTIQSSLFGKIEVKTPCLLMIRRNVTKQIELAVADPTQQLREIVVTIKGKRLATTLPEGGMAGSTVWSVVEW